MATAMSSATSATYNKNTYTDDNESETWKTKRKEEE